MPSITSWMRLEPRSRNAEMDASLQARIYDPLWLLARQWQLGEFQGEDRGSPVIARWRGEGAPLTRFHPGPIAPNTIAVAPRYDSRSMPLETLVERETVRPSGDQASSARLRLAAESGLHFLRVLEQQPLSQPYREAFIREYPFPALTDPERAALDADSRSFCDMMAARVPDGRRLYAVLRPASNGRIALSPALGIASGDMAEVEQAALRWRRWLETLFNEPDADLGAWLPERMEYGFSIAAGLSDGEAILTAQEYADGHLDWYAFDLNPEVTLGAPADRAMTPLVQTVMPAPVSYRGAPSRRFWEFEDAQVDWGAVDAGPTDLARMLLVEFALTYGDDWFVIPVDLPVGSVYRSRSLVISDTFGVRELIAPVGERPAPASEWRMFQHAYLRGSGLARPDPRLFVLTPALLANLESRPHEEVLLLRDEMANLAWAVERVIESAVERPINRFEAAARSSSVEPPAQASAGQALRYRLTTEVPPYWIPLLPVATPRGLRLKRGAVLSTDGAPHLVPSAGRILTPDPDRPLELYEEEVPREGVRVTRSYQYARWIDGSTHLWIGRRKQVGRGEGSSGLRFDRLEDES